MNTTEDTTSAEEETLDFGKLQKKKKTKAKKPTSIELQDEGSSSGDQAEPTATGAADVDGVGHAAPGSCADSGLYSYGYLLGRLREALQEEHPSHPSLRTDERHRSHVPPPQLAKVVCAMCALSLATTTRL